MRSANLAVAFMLEIAMLAAFALWGWSIGSGTIAQVALAVVAPVLVAGLWGALLAPKSPRRLGRPWLEAVKLVLFALAGLALWTTGRAAWGLTLVLVSVVSLALAVALGQDEVAGRP